MQLAIDHAKAVDSAPKGGRKEVMPVAIRARGARAEELAGQLAAPPAREIAVGPVIRNGKQARVRVNQAFAGIVEGELLDAPRRGRRAAALHVVYGAECHLIVHRNYACLRVLPYLTGWSPW